LKPIIAASLAAHRAWFEIRPAANGMLIIDTFGSSFDTVLAVYTPANLTGSNLLVVCNNDAFPNVTWSKTPLSPPRTVFIISSPSMATTARAAPFISTGALEWPPTNLPMSPRSMSAWGRG